MTSVRIRPVDPADIPAIAAIYADAVLNGTASFELEPPSPEEMERRRAVIVSGGFPYFVAEHEGTVVGYAYAGPYRPRPAYRWTVEDSIYVAPDWQGRGVGRTLLAALIEEATRLGFRRMVAVIGDSGSHGSIALHAALGFTHAGTLVAVGYKHGRWLDTVDMQRPLGEGAGTAPI